MNDAKEKFTIFMDGPAGAGKSTLAKNIIESDVLAPYSIFAFDGGDLFRAVTVHILNEGISELDPKFPEHVIRFMQTMDFFSINSADLRSTEVNKMVAKVAAVPRAREEYLQKVPNTIQSAPQDIVIHLSRSIGHYYSANTKLYIHAPIEICANRRAREEAAKGKDFETAYLDLIERNKQDMLNWGDKFLPAPDAFTIDTDDLSPEKALNQAIQKIEPAFNTWKFNH